MDLGRGSRTPRARKPPCQQRGSRTELPAPPALTERAPGGQDLGAAGAGERRHRLGWYNQNLPPSPWEQQRQGEVSGRAGQGLVCPVCSVLVPGGFRERGATLCNHPQPHRACDRSSAAHTLQGRAIGAAPRQGPGATHRGKAAQPGLVGPRSRLHTGGLLRFRSLPPLNAHRPPAWHPRTRAGSRSLPPLHPDDPGHLPGPFATRGPRLQLGLGEEEAQPSAGGAWDGEEPAQPVLRAAATPGTTCAVKVPACTGPGSKGRAATGRGG